MLAQIPFNIISCLSLFLDVILITLIIKKSSLSMANYKYLMLISSFLKVFMGVLHFINQPKVHFYQASYVIYSENPVGLPRVVSFWVLALDCSAFAMTLYLLAFHFVYRYLAALKPDQLYLFTFPYSLVFIGIFSFMTLNWWLSAVFFAGEIGYVDEYIGLNMRQKFNLTRMDFTYVSSIFYKKNLQTGVEEPSLHDFLLLINLMFIIDTGFLIIGYCWIKLQKVFSHTTKEYLSLSKRTLEMQTQLFKCIVAQTLFPMFFLLIPSGCILLFPLFKFEPGPIETIFLPMMGTQTVLDSMVPMYFIKNYRMAIHRFFVREPTMTGTSIGVFHARVL